MSWQAYVDTNLIGSGKLSKAAILGLLGGVWAASPGYSITDDQRTALVNAFSNEASRDHILTNGVVLGDKKFFTVQANERSIYGKKQADGCIIVKTTQAILVAEYVAPFQSQEVAGIVENLADYLINLKY